MKNYYTKFGIDKNATSKEIKQQYNKYVSDGNLTTELKNIYEILSDYHSRRKYDDTLNLLKINIPFFGYDFDERYVETYKSFEKKRYYIDTNRFLIYEKSNINGKIVKTFNQPNLDIYLGQTKSITHQERNEEQIEIIITPVSL